MNSEVKSGIRRFPCSCCRLPAISEVYFFVLVKGVYVIKRVFAYRMEQGFTLAEAMVVVVLVALLTSIALPPCVEWHKSAKYRSSTREILSILRETRKMAISENLEHRVEFENENKRYRVIRGNRANNSSDWNTIVRDWTVLPSEVYLHANVDKIHLNPLGTSNAATITIQDESAQAKYRIRIVSTGRARIL